MRVLLNTRGFRAQLVIAILALLFSAAVAPAATYGEVEVTIKSEPRGTATHGYAEVEFLVVNRSAQASHDVRIIYPKSSYGSGSDHLRAVSRSVTVEPGKTVRVSLAFPERLQSSGNGATVAIDGREQEDVLPVGDRYSSRSYGSRSGGAQLFVFYSKTVDTRFPDWTNSHRWGRGDQVECIRADQDADQWSTNWLGYTRYDGVVVTATDLKKMPTEVRNAIGQYVECGGSLLVLGRDAPLPGPWKLRPHPLRSISTAAPGFGECIVKEQTELQPWGDPTFGPILDSWSWTSVPWRRVRDANDANRVFPVVDDIGVPVKGLLALMFVFAIIIGPVNLVVLARKKRKLWLFWTVPLISLLTCLTVFVYMAATEGWKGQSRVDGFTVLDENSRRASSLGWTGFYTPLLPRGGLHFSPETEVCYQNGEDDPYGYGYSSRGRRSAGSALSIDWTKDQHLSSGWLTPRVPAHFMFRKSELRRERMTISKGAGGVPEAVNGLGADLSEFWYKDEAGNLFHAGAIAAGERTSLEARPLPRAHQLTRASPLRDMFSGDWSGLPEHMRVYGHTMLAPRTYLAVLEGAPFLDDGMPGASVRKSRSVVYGICKEGGDGG